LLVPFLQYFLSFLNLRFSQIFMNCSNSTLVTAYVVLVFWCVWYFCLNESLIVLLNNIPDLVNLLQFFGLWIPTLDSWLLLILRFDVACNSLKS
jgi:hypothetical protein